MSASKSLIMKVRGETAATLKMIAKASKLSIGEVVDRLILNMSSHDSNLADIVSSQETRLVMSQLSDEDCLEPYIALTCSFLAACPPESLDEMVAMAKLRRKRAIEKMNPMSDEETDKLVGAIRNFNSPLG